MELETVIRAVSVAPTPIDTIRRVLVSGISFVTAIIIVLGELLFGFNTMEQCRPDTGRRGGTQGSSARIQEA